VFLHEAPGTQSQGFTNSHLGRNTVWPGVSFTFSAASVFRVEVLMTLIRFIRHFYSSIHGVTSRKTLIFLVITRGMYLCIHISPLSKSPALEGLCLTLKVFTNSTAYWDVMLCSVVDRYRRFGENCCFHLRSRRCRQHNTVPITRRTTDNMIIRRFAALRFNPL